MVHSSDFTPAVSSGQAASRASWGVGNVGNRDIDSDMSSVLYCAQVPNLSPASDPKGKIS